MNYDKSEKIIALASMTHAMKAQKLLTSNGYHCETVKIPPTHYSKCGYGIKVNEDIQTILTLLEKSGFAVLNIYEKGELHG